MAKENLMCASQAEPDVDYEVDPFGAELITGTDSERHRLTNTGVSMRESFGGRYAREKKRIAHVRENQVKVA